MGISLTSIHIYGNTMPENCGFTFRSFSPNWLTCVDNFSETKNADIYDAAKLISKHVSAPVLCFGVFNSETIWFEFFRNGKVAARYDDDEFVANKKIYDIPALIGYEEGHKRRLSSILACLDVDLKIKMLEEFFGVGLLYMPGIEDAETLCRHRSDQLFRKYQKDEKALSGKGAPMRIILKAEYPGKIFWYMFGKSGTVKPHFYLYGYASEDSMEDDHRLIPVEFAGPALEVSDFDTFMKDRIPHNLDDKRFEMKHGTLSKVTFSQDCPPDYRGRTMTLPNGFYPEEFLPSGELLLQGKQRIFIADKTFKIIAKMSIKGTIADIRGNYILTTTGYSFGGYCYESHAKIYVYEIVKR